MDADAFRESVRGLVRALGVLDAARTPCGVDLSVREAYALSAIADAESLDEALSQSELQALLGVDKSNVTRVVQELVTRGHVQQRVEEQDARVRRLHLTSLGRRAAHTLDQRSLARFARVLARIPKSEQAALLRSMRTLQAALEAEREE